jgi:hypothetical protein
MKREIHEHQEIPGERGDDNVVGKKETKELRNLPYREFNTITWNRSSNGLERLKRACPSIT